MSEEQLSLHKPTFVFKTMINSMDARKYMKNVTTYMQHHLRLSMCKKVFSPLCIGQRGCLFFKAVDEVSMPLITNFEVVIHHVKNQHIMQKPQLPPHHSSPFVTQ